MIYNKKTNESSKLYIILSIWIVLILIATFSMHAYNHHVVTKELNADKQAILLFLEKGEACKFMELRDALNAYRKLDSHKDSEGYVFLHKELTSKELKSLEDIAKNHPEVDDERERIIYWNGEDYDAKFIEEDPRLN